MKKKESTLFYYEHCPYCVRVLTAAGLIGVSLNVQVLLNDDEKTPIEMVGEKIVPILAKPSGDMMIESLDIIDYLYEQNNSSLLKKPLDIEWVNLFLSENRMSIYSLSMPRWTQLPFAEFATDTAIAYFTEKKSQTIGDFSLALSQTASFSSALQQAMREEKELFKEMLAKPHSQAAIILFAGLHGVSCVKDFSWPDEAWTFMQGMSQVSGMSLLTAQAL